MNPRTPDQARVPGVVLRLLAACITMAATNAAAAPLVQEQTIPLEGVSGRIDHIAVDVAGGRLFVAELGNGSVDLIDLHAGKVVRRISGLKQPQGIGYVSGQDLIVVASAGDGSARFFRAADLSPVGSVALGEDADNVRVDPASGHVLIGYGNGGLAIIDPATQVRLGAIKLPGHPESFQLDPKLGRAYINVPDAHQIAVVDLKSRKQVEAWNTPGLRANFPMALAHAGSLLAVVFRAPARLAILDPATGKPTASLETCGDADDVAFDDNRNRIYISCGDGTVDVVQRTPEAGLRRTPEAGLRRTPEAGLRRTPEAGLRHVGLVTTSRGARTSVFVPELDRLFVAVPAKSLGSEAAIRVFRPSP